MNSRSISTPKEFAAAAEKIYGEKFQQQYEASHLGSFLAVDVTSEQACIGDTAQHALKAAREAAPNGLFYLVRIGVTQPFRSTSYYA